MMSVCAIYPFPIYTLISWRMFVNVKKIRGFLRNKYYFTCIGFGNIRSNPLIINGQDTLPSTGFQADD